MNAAESRVQAEDGASESDVDKEAVGNVDKYTRPFLHYVY